MRDDVPDLVGPNGWTTEHLYEIRDQDGQRWCGRRWPEVGDVLVEHPYGKPARYRVVDRKFSLGRRRPTCHVVVELTADAYT